jgi:hypothetical protein
VEDRIKEFLEGATTLRPIIYDEGQAKNIWPCITFHFYADEGAVFASGKAEIETVNCQVDFWYKAKTSSKYGEIKDRIQEVKQAIVNEKTFTHPKKGHMLETDTKIYHTYLTFELIKKGGE